jgi:acetyl esterase/lipase
MIVQTEYLWDKNQPATYVKYLLDNSPEIHSERKHPAIIVCGGGAYMGISDREKEPVALYFLNQGYQAFVLNYATKSIGDPVYPNPVYDLAKMVLTIREHADEWNIDPNKITAVGFSAGAHLCACLATQWHEDYLSSKLKVNSDLLRLNAVILSYPLLDFLYQKHKVSTDKDRDVAPATMPFSKGEITRLSGDIMIGENATDEMCRIASPFYHITDKTPPTFIWHTASDELVYVGQSLRFSEKLHDLGIPFELHIFETGVHGLSLANEQSSNDPLFINHDVAIWTDLAMKFLNRHLQ